MIDMSDIDRVIKNQEELRNIIFALSLIYNTPVESFTVSKRRGLCRHNN